METTDSTGGKVEAEKEACEPETVIAGLKAAVAQLKERMAERDKLSAAHGLEVAICPDTPFIPVMDVWRAIYGELNELNAERNDPHAWEEAKKRAFARLKTQNDALAAEHGAKIKADAEVAEAERKQKIAEAWAEWERLDDARAVAYQALEDASRNAHAAASTAYQAYPADKSMLPKRYSTSPATIDGCAALAKSQSEMIRKLRDKANEAAA